MGARKGGKLSTGLLMYRLRGGGIEVLLAHPGGPFFVRKDEGAWTIPKGELDANEEPLACAKREFEEETGLEPRASDYIFLGEIEQRNRKVVVAWAFEGVWGERELVSNSFELEWPPRSGRLQRFPEIDRVQFFSLDDARRKLNPAQTPFLDRLRAKLP
jgi:predicted NUDIX family NTP pyrophosphohydrolase